MKVIDNILICNPGKIQQDVQDLMIETGLDNFIQKLANGINTEAGKKRN